MDSARENVVVVDDDGGMSLAISRLLNAAGFRASTFPSAEDFLNANAAANAACLVLDIHLPGLSGFELQKKLASSGSIPPVIFITAFDDPGSLAQAVEARAIAYFTKPFPGGHLVAAVKRALNKA